MFEYTDSGYLDLKNVASYVSSFRLPIAYAKQSIKNSKLCHRVFNDHDSTAVVNSHVIPLIFVPYFI